MPLNVSGLKNSLKTAFMENLNQENADASAKAAAEVAAENLANSFAAAMETFVKSGTVTFATGSVQGACPVGGGPLGAGSASGGTIS